MENTITFNKEQTNRLIVKKLSNKEKDALIKGGLTIGGLLSGVGLYKLFGHTNIQEVNSVADENIENFEECLIFETTAPFASSVNDSMSFSEAFAAARKEVGSGGFFEWQGSTYNTFTKEEWDLFTEEEKEQYFASVSESTDHNSATIANQSEIHESPNNEHSEEIIFASEVEVVDVNPDIIYVDGNDDGYLEMAVVDDDLDGYADAILVDSDADGNYDSYYLDVDGDEDIDILIVDELQDGLDSDDIVIDENLDIVINMSDYEGDNTELDNSIQFVDGMEEDIADMDSDFDMEAF